MVGCIVGSPPASAWGLDTRFGGPVAFVGEQVVFQQGTSEIDLVRPGGVPRRLVQGPGESQPLSSEYATLRFGASTSLLAFTSSFDDAYHGATCLYGCGAKFGAGPLAGGYSQLWSCASSPYSPAFAVSIATLAYAIPTCVDAFEEQDPTFDRIVVHDTTAGADSDVTIPLNPSAQAIDLALVGRALAAVTDRSELRVWDASSGDLRYAARLSQYGDLTPDLHVQEDGTAVFLVDRTPTCQEIAWASPSAPREHVVAGCASGGGIQVESGWVVFVAHGSINTSPIGGRTRRALLEVGHIPVYAFDVDAARLITSLPACDGGARLDIRDVTAGTPSTVSPVCSGRIPSQRPRLSRGRVDVRVVCKSGCVGRVELTAKRGARLGGTDFRIPSSITTQDIRVRLRRGVALAALGTIQASLIIRRLDGRRTVEAPTPLALPRHKPVG